VKHLANSNGSRYIQKAAELEFDYQ
jgi:hypothetical protein